MNAKERLFIGNYPCGIVYADRAREKHGDYMKLAFLSYKGLDLQWHNDCPKEVRELIEASAKDMQGRKGEFYQISTCGQGVILGQ